MSRSHAYQVHAVGGASSGVEALCAYVQLNTLLNQYFSVRAMLHFKSYGTTRCPFQNITRDSNNRLSIAL
jgi:hypothetical protein